MLMVLSEFFILGVFICCNYAELNLWQVKRRWFSETINRCPDPFFCWEYFQPAGGTKIRGSKILDSTIWVAFGLGCFIREIKPSGRKKRHQKNTKMETKNDKKKKSGNISDWNWGTENKSCREYNLLPSNVLHLSRTLKVGLPLTLTRALKKTKPSMTQLRTNWRHKNVLCLTKSTFLVVRPTDHHRWYSFEGQSE